jgi:hypothetical protein
MVTGDLLSLARAGDGEAFREAAQRADARPGSGTCLSPDRSCRPRATRPSGCSRFLTPSSRVPSTGHPPQKLHAREGVTRRSDRLTVRGTANEPARRTDEPRRQGH